MRSRLWVTVRIVLWTVATAVSEAAAGGQESPQAAPQSPEAGYGPPALSRAEKSAVMKVARGMLEALWSGGNVDDVPGAALRGHDLPVAVALRRSGETLARCQAHSTNLAESLREALTAAVAEAKGKTEGAAVGAADLRLDVEIAGRDEPVQFRHIKAVTVAGVTARFLITAEVLAELRREKGAGAVPESVQNRLKALLNKPFADEKGLRAELIKTLPPDELIAHQDKVIRFARTSAPANISEDILEQCRRGIHGLLIEHHAKRIAHGRTYPGETVADNVTPVEFVSRAMHRAYLPKALLAVELRKLIDDGSVRVFRFRSCHLVETDGRGGWWEPVRGHATVEPSDVTEARVTEAVRELAEYMVRRQVLLNALNYYPSVDLADPADGPTDRATAAWAMAEAAAAFPRREFYHRLALAGLGRLAVSTRLIPVPARPTDFLPIRPEERGVAEPAKRDGDVRRIRVVPESDGERAHLGAAALTVVAMTRFPLDRPRTVRVPDPDFVGPAPVDQGKAGAGPRIIDIDVTAPRDQLLLSVLWMQNREFGPPARPLGVNPRPGEPPVSWFGSFRTWYPPADKQPLGHDLYGGQALYAISAVYAQMKEPAGRKFLREVRNFDDKALAELERALLICLRDAVAFYGPRFRKQPSLEAAGWQIPAFAAAYLWSGDPVFGEHVLHMADWLLLRQSVEGNAVDPDVLGGFVTEHDATARPGVSSALYVNALCSAAETADKAGDDARARRCRAAVRLGTRFLLQLQFRPQDTYYCRRPDLARGGIRLEIADNAIHQSGCAHTLMALLRARQVLWPAGRD